MSGASEATLQELLATNKAMAASMAKLAGQGGGVLITKRRGRCWKWPTTIFMKERPCGQCRLVRVLIKEYRTDI